MEQEALNPQRNRDDGLLDQRLTTQLEKEQGEDGSTGDSAVKEWFGLLVRAGFWALLIYQFVFQVSVVRGSSMQPNFQNEDRLLIDKLTYRFSDPQPGDAVVFEAVVSKPKTGARVHRDYIKRIIAGPNSVVRILGGKVYVDNQVLAEPWTPEPFSRLADYPTVYVVPPHRYFVLGDRRGDSEDSRRPKIGYVSSRQLKGKVRCRFFPIGRWQWF